MGPRVTVKMCHFCVQCKILLPEKCAKGTRCGAKVVYAPKKKSKKCERCKNTNNLVDDKEKQKAGRVTQNGKCKFVIEQHQSYEVEGTCLCNCLTIVTKQVEQINLHAKP